MFNIILFSVTHKMQGSKQHSTNGLESLSKIWLKTYHLQGLGHRAWLEFLQGIKSEWSIYRASEWGVVTFLKFIKIRIPRLKRERGPRKPWKLLFYVIKSQGPVNPSPSKAGNVFRLEYSLQDMCLKSILMLEGIHKEGQGLEKIQQDPGKIQNLEPNGLRIKLGLWTCWSTN